MNNREKIISAIEKAKKQSEEYAQDRIIVPFKEADMILALLKEQEAKVMNAQFAEMTFKNGNSMFLNTEYITSYGYLKDRDETAVSVLSEAKEIYFPGNQTAEIRSAFNRINEDRR